VRVRLGHEAGFDDPNGIGGDRAACSGDDGGPEVYYEGVGWTSVSSFMDRIREVGEKPTMIFPQHFLRLIIYREPHRPRREIPHDNRP